MTTEQHKGEHTGLDLLKVGSKDVFTDNISKIGQLFPEVLTEKRDEHGRLRPAIDFEKLKQFLSEEIVDGRESYEFTWVGKREAIAEAGRPTTKTLRPDLDESVDSDKSENIFITGDNLEVLKILQESYLGKIDMIYIDPPYNTGRDFVYSDRFQKTDQELKEEMDLLDEEGRQVVGLKPNEKSSAGYHSDWLNMMYPRLRLARNLLKDSGVIFISIDDNEQANLKVMCDEIFGEENLISQICHKARASISNDKIISNSHNTILLYAKKERVVFANRQTIGLNPNLEGFNKEDERGKYKLVPVDGPGGGKKGNPFYEFLGIEKYWRFSKTRMKEMYDTGLIVKTQNNLQQKYYLNNAINSRKTVTSWWDESFYTSSATSQLKKLMGDNYFDTPKPVSLIKKMLEMFTALNKDAIILDFFGGSGTTADAVMQLNAEDGGNRKFILCTLDEEVADKSAAKEAGYETIDQISRERIRRAAAKIQEEHPELVGKQDFGFKAYKLDSSNFKDVSARPDQFIQGELFDSVSNIKEDRTGLDLLFQVMLTWGMELSLAVDLKNVAGAEVFDVDQGSLMACFEDDISEEVIRYIAQAQPLRTVFRDSSFANSADKINVSEIFKELSPNTKVKVV